MRFQVPQFIDVEDKIFGPLSLKQFIYVAGGGGMSFLLYRFLNFYLAVLCIVPVMAFATAMAFYKINEKPLIFTIEAAFRYFFSTKLYIWKKQEKKVIKKAEESVEEESLLVVPKLSDSKLKDLTWSLDINEALNPITREKRK
jgi:hypothetical protein